jgi:hypothetical protein
MAKQRNKRKTKRDVKKDRQRTEVPSRRQRAWNRRSKAEITRRLGRRLGVEFVALEPLGPGGTARRLASLGHDAWVALELERKHARPVHNVLRYWPWLDRTRRRLVVIHAIVPEARRQTGPRSNLTLWLGALMERVLPGRFTYCRLELGSEREAVQLEAARAAVAELRRPALPRRLAAGL